MTAEIELFPLPDSEPRINVNQEELFLMCVRKLKMADLVGYIENIRKEGRSVRVAVINYKNLDGPALDILVDGDSTHMDASYKRKTALHHAALSCNPEFISKLVEHDAHGTSRDANGRTPLHYILDYCDVRIIENLKLKFETDENSDDDEPFCDVPLYVMKLVNELYNRSISIHNIIASAKILIKCSMLWDVVMYKNWCKKRKVKLLPEVLNYLKSCISEVQSMKAKKITHNLQLYTLVTGKCNGRSYYCSPSSAKVIIKHMVNASNKKGYHIYHDLVSRKIDRLHLENHLLECFIYQRSEDGKRKLFLNPESISSVCKNLDNADLLNLIIAVSVTNENRCLYS
ncbi:hypothetical protein TNCV_4837111 [Trichonephila clavipes]|nr:hypothetical protein TNCV_4837111 [Trichonephila clavipes]